MKKYLYLYFNNNVNKYKNDCGELFGIQDKIENLS